LSQVLKKVYFKKEKRVREFRTFKKVFTRQEIQKRALSARQGRFEK